MTHQRRLILEELKKVKTHPTADEIYVIVRKTMPRISLGTVYRNLEILSAMGLIIKIEGFGNQRRFDGNTNKHYHIRCIKCGKIDDLPEDAITNIEVDHNKIKGYSIYNHEIQLSGICEQCHNAK
ncbi:MAG: transcriptional repressor [Candidatus Latescibacteria bacterium]|nr:transcriptional repressor [Candidatus Latescibacterota bacterium]